MWIVSLSSVSSLYIVPPRSHSITVWVIRCAFVVSQCLCSRCHNGDRLCNQCFHGIWLWLAYSTEHLLFYLIMTSRVVMLAIQMCQRIAVKCFHFVKRHVIYRKQNFIYIGFGTTCEFGHLLRFSKYISLRLGARVRLLYWLMNF